MIWSDFVLEVKTYKNWKEICEAMEWKTTGGTYKKARLKELESMCSYNKKGNKIVIEEIYEERKDIVDNRGKNKNSHHNKKSVFTNDIKIAILSIILKDIKENNKYNILDKNTAVYSRKILLEKLAMINKNYSVMSNNKRGYAEFRGIDLLTVDDFFNSADRKIKRDIENAIKSLKNNCNVVKIPEDVLMISFLEDELDENGNPKYITKTVEDSHGNKEKITYKKQKASKPVLATDKQVTTILDIQFNSMLDLGCENMFEVIYRKLYDTYIDLFTERIREVKGFENFNYCYEVYKFQFNIDNIRKFLEIKGYNPDDDIRINTGIINEKVVKSLYKSIKIKINNAIKSNDDKFSFRLEEDYEDNIRQIIDDGISKEGKEIRNYLSDKYNYLSKKEDD